ncbi:MAG: hydantoinase B/oxoprolinase family protein [Chloroflexota bacterium]
MAEIAPRRPAAGRGTAVDPITMQVVRYAMEQVADEMGYTMMRTARSTVIKEVLDFSCSLADGQGRTIAQAHHVPMLLGSLDLTMKRVLEHYHSGPERLEEGDVVIANDPYLGGQHVMDMQVFAPVFDQGRLIGMAGNIAHQADMGGMAPGGVAGGMTEIFQEGIRFSMIKLSKRGVEDPEVVRMIASNVRIPDVTLGDMRSQVSAANVGARRFLEIYRKHGSATFEAAVSTLLDYSEQRVRHGLRQIPDGSYSGEDFVDDDGITDEPLRVAVTIHKQGDAIEVDFAGTSLQARGNINCPIASTCAAVYYVVLALADPHVPANGGAFRPITFTVPEGTVVNPRPPAGVTARSNTAAKIVEAMFRAFGQAMPERVVSGSHAQSTTCGFVGYHPRTGKRFSFTDIEVGGAPARPYRDGRDGQDSHLARFMNTPIEAAEMEFPILTERLQFRPDSGGAGTYRGGLAVQRDIKLLADVSFARYADRHKFHPWGIAGGRDGDTGSFVLNPGTEHEEQVRSKGLSQLKAGDVVSLRLPGAGGYGSPFERDPDAVSRDVREGKVTQEAARRDYGVALTPELAVDEKETAHLRVEGVALDPPQQDSRARTA